MAGQGLLLVAGNLVVGQAGEIVVALVVLLHMLEAEHEVLVLGIAPDRRLVDSILPAAVPLAGGRHRLRFLARTAPCPDAVKIF